MNLQKVNPGDPLVIPAVAYNTFVDAARDYLARQQDQAQTRQAGARHSGIVLVRNDSGSDRSRFDVLGVAGAVFDPAADLDAFKNCPALSGVTPSAVFAHWPVRRAPGAHRRRRNRAGHGQRRLSGPRAGG